MGSLAELFKPMEGFTPPDFRYDVLDVNRCDGERDGLLMPRFPPLSPAFPRGERDLVRRHKIEQPAGKVTSRGMASAARKAAFLMIAIALSPLSCAPHPEPPLAELRAGAGEAPLDYASSLKIPVGWRLLRALDPPDASPFLFVHLADGNGRMMRAYDRPIPENRADGDAIEIWQSVLAEPLPAGRYRLTAGIYDLSTGRRWRLETNGEEIAGGEYQIAAIEVDSTRRKTPDLVFEGEWLEPDKGQWHNPGRRWMGEGGTIRLLRTTGWSELVLTISINESPESRLRPGHEGGAPRLIIRNGCDDGSETLIDRYGTRSIALRLDGGDHCTITLEPSFVALGADGERRSVGLEAAYFRPSDPV